MLDPQTPNPSALAAEIAAGAGISPARHTAAPTWAAPAWLHIGTLRGFEWNRLDLPVLGLPPVLQGLRIVHLSDTHFRSRWSRAYDTFLERLRHDPPDLLLFTGDLMDEKLDS